MGIIKTVFQVLSGQSKKRILIIEDDPLLRPILTRLVQSLGGHCEVSWAVKIEDGMEILKSKKMDLVISDYFLPGDLNGVDLYSQLNRTHTRPTPKYAP